MLIKNKKINGNRLEWILRCPTSKDALELSKLRVKIDSETENLYRESGEGYLSEKDFEKRISGDIDNERNLFLVAETNNKLVGYARCEGKTLSRFRHQAEFGICILKEYWGFGIGKELLQTIINWSEEVGIEKITLDVIETNVNAIKLYKNFGFIPEGLLIKDRKHKDGNYYNTLLMGRIKK